MNSSAHNRRDGQNTGSQDGSVRQRNAPARTGGQKGSRRQTGERLWIEHFLELWDSVLETR